MECENDAAKKVNIVCKRISGNEILLQISRNTTINEFFDKIKEKLPETLVIKAVICEGSKIPHPAANGKVLCELDGFLIDGGDQVVVVTEEKEKTIAADKGGTRRVKRKNKKRRSKRRYKKRRSKRRYKRKPKTRKK